MNTYLLTFTKLIPDGSVPKKEQWSTAISANGIIDAKQTARYVGSALRTRLPKGYDITLDAIDYVN